MRKLLSTLSSTLQGGVRAVLLLLALFASVSAIYASDTQVDGIWYDFDSSTKTASVTYRGSASDSYEAEYSGSVVIPETVTYNGTTYSVTSIGSGAFADCSSLTSVTIPNSVTSIGEWAFYDCSSLTSVTIGNSVTSIGYYAFYGCTSLTKTNYTGDIAGWCNIKFGNYYANPMCYSRNFYINDQEIKDLVIPNSVTSIGDWAFFYCSSLTSVTIPNSVTSIGEEAFEYCSSLTSMTIPNTVTSIGYYAFYGCPKLTSVTINSDAIVNQAYSSSSNISHIFGSQVTKYIIGDDVKGIGEYAFCGCSKLTSVTIGNSVTSIGESAFDGCSKLTKTNYTGDIAGWCNIKFGSYSANPMCYSHNFYINNHEIKNLVIPNSVTSIGNYAFEYCSSLTSVTIPNSVTSIGSSAFSACSSLTSVTIPNNVTSIGNYAFEGCSSLTSVTIPNSVTSIGDEAFEYCSKLTSVIIGESVTSIGNGAFYWCSSLTSVTIGESVTSIGNSAFSGCSKLTSVTINSEDIVSKDYSFNSNISDISDIFGSQVTEYIIGNKVKGIGRYAFYCCSSLTSVTIGESVTSIGDWAFFGSSLTSVTIPNSVTSIGERAFSNCSSLTSVTIPNSVTSIGDYAFYSCSSLTSITCEAETPPTVGSDAFYTVSKSIPVYVPCGCVEAYKAASGWNVFNNIQDPLAEFSISLTINNSNMGTAKVDKNTACGNQISATANYGYHFVRWSDGNSDNPRSLGLTQDTVLTAEFAINQYTVTTRPSHNERGTTQGDTTVNYLDIVTICANASYGYHFTQWNDGNVENPRQVQVTGDATYIATFDKNTYAISLSCNEEQGSVEGVTSAEYLDTVTISATPNIGYHFLQWSDGNGDNPRTLMLTQDTTFTAEFAINQYTVTTRPSHNERGTTQGDTTVNYLENVTISATANYGYHFSHWNDYNYDNPRQVQVTENKIYTAYFDKNTYYITKNYNSNQGYVNGSTSGEYLDNITLTAEPNYGYHFLQWSDGNGDNPRTLTLTQDTVLTAEFALTIAGQCGDNLYWSYNESDQTISITGSGKMYDYTADTQPWFLFEEQIMEVITSNTATSIGTSAFEGCLRLGKVSLGAAMENVAANAFASCTRLYDIYSYATYPPFADESSFANYNVYVYVPCEYQRGYTLDVVWGKFKFIECIESEDATTDGNVTVVPGYNDVTITWPTEGNADTYTIVIKKGNEVFCTLTFNKDGQLLNIAFAPGRDGNNRPTQYAEQAGKGYRFTVTGLEEGTHYTYNIDVKNTANQTINSHTGAFTTQSTTAVDNITTTTANIQKIIRDGQLIILRDGVEYNAMGQEL